MTSRSSPYETIELDGERVRACRLARRLSQQRLATEAAPVSRGYISIIESQHQASVSLDLARRLAVALGTDVSDLMAEQKHVDKSLVAEAGRKATATTSSPRKKARGIRFGAGYPLAPKQRVDLLRNVLRQTQEIEQTVLELLDLEEEAK